MRSNFSFLENKKEYELFSKACIDAENVLSTSSTMSTVASRKALELCVKWVYSVDTTLQKTNNDGLQYLLHNNGFPSLMDYSLWRRLQYVVKNGNISVHTSRVISKDDAILSLNIVYDLVQWIDYCYGREYLERHFDEKLIPNQSSDGESLEAEYKTVIADIQKNADKIVDEKDKRIQELLLVNLKLSAQITASKTVNIKNRTYCYDDNMSEFSTRKRYIDADLKNCGYIFDQHKHRNCIQVEYPVNGMPNETGTGYADYVIWGDTGKIIALVEAKKASVSADIGKNQGKIYADCIEKMQELRPIIFYTNGFETYLWDDEISTPRLVSGVFPKQDINKMIEKRYIRKPLNTIKIDEKITNRYYQLRAVTKCCENFAKGVRKCLLVMATGTGKTRTAASVVDVMTRSELMQNVLFLADRKELVKQAKEAFGNHIPKTTSCNLILNKADRKANFIFSTYPTILNAIDNQKNEDGSRFFSPGHFDLIVIDEAHRSIFNKYGAIFNYFDANLLGLTATPRKSVHRSTYQFFEMKSDMPTDVYEYDEAVNKDHVLVPFYLIETATQIPDDGITYKNLDTDEQGYYEDEFVEDEGIPERIPPERINKYIFNNDTVDMMLSDLMKNGIRHKNGNHVGKTIIFAQSKKHAKFIIERFDKLYSELKGDFCKLVVCDEPYADKNLKDFRKPDVCPFITVTVDMLETGIDVPEIVNLVFAKKIYSRIKFDQMIGRGTRLCPDLFGDGEDKKEFYIFDYMRNFQFFDENPKGKSEIVSTIAPIALRFSRRVQLIKLLQDANFQCNDYPLFRKELVTIVLNDIRSLNSERIEVKLELRYLEQYKDENKFVCLDEVNQEEIIGHLAPLILSNEKDEAAINFDTTMYGIMIALIAGNKNYNRMKQSVISNANTLLTKCGTIPDVKAKIPDLKDVVGDTFWTNPQILTIEEFRKSLRDIMKFVPDKSPKLHYTDFQDSIVFREEGRKFDMTSSDFDDYRIKVNEYIDNHKQDPAIRKLIYNEPISNSDYQELENLFTKELGTKEDYEINYKDTPFGILIRKIAKMDRDAAYKAFASYIVEERPNANQIHFIEQVVDYVVENGCINNVIDLMNTPFDRPYKFGVLFTREEQIKIFKIIHAFKSNAGVA